MRLALKKTTAVCSIILQTTPGPDRESAKRWVVAALVAGRFTLSRHCRKRCEERKMTFADIRWLLVKCHGVEPYAGMPQSGGTCWRISGKNVDGDRRLSVGIEVYRDENDEEQVTICTVIADAEEL